MTAAVGHRQIDMKFSFDYTKEEVFMLFDIIGKLAIDVSPYSIYKSPLDDAIELLDDFTDGKIESARVLLMPHGKIQT